jgi:transcription elongation factor GreA-like protein
MSLANIYNELVEILISYSSSKKWPKKRKKVMP